MTNVLIVEDEQAIRRFLRTALEGDGLRVYEADTLQRGLLEAATRKPDLIILDLGYRMATALILFAICASGALSPSSCSLPAVKRATKSPRWMPVPMII